MPSPYQDSQNRPSLPARQSSSSVSFALPNAEGLSTSAQRQRPQRHVVGGQQARLGSRNPSYGKNLNKLLKQNQTRVPELAISPRASNVRRNLSNTHLPRDQSSATALRKNHSETSLRRNRSGAHLSKLARPAITNKPSSRSTKRAKEKRSSKSTLDDHDEPQAPTVRFDVNYCDTAEGEEDVGFSRQEQKAGDDEWADASNSRSPSVTPVGTRPSSVVRPERIKPPEERLSEQNLLGRTLTQSDVSWASRSTPQNDDSNKPAPPASERQPLFASSRHPDADRITSRLLKRNVSFNAAPQVSSISATPVQTGMHTPPSAGHNTLNDSTSAEIVSRFIQGGESSGTPRGSNFLPSRPHSPPDRVHNDSDERTSPRHNLSFPNFISHAPSRTQQKLNLERESVYHEQNRTSQPPIGLMQAYRYSTINMPLANVPDSRLGRMDPHLRQLFDQTDAQYRRIRQFHDPLGDAIKRLQTSGLDLRTRTKVETDAKKQSPKPNGVTSNGQHSELESGVKGRDAVKANGGVNGGMKKPRVIFQGISDSPDGNHQTAKVNGVVAHAETPAAKAQRDDIKELCRRLWTSGESEAVTEGD